jgi:two-component system response regulator YesN
VRVEKAKQLLFDPSLRVTDVAFNAGFQSLHHFESTFKRYTGSTPNAYRAVLCRQWR